VSARSFVNAANLATAGSLGTGFIVLILAGQHEFTWAAGMVVLALVLDVLDGVLARKLSVCGPFGTQLDSLADVVSFGVAPALLLYLGGLDSVPVVGVAACLAYLLAGAWRLARFPLIEEPYRFVGLPIPTAAIIAAGMAVWSPGRALTVAVAFVLAALMVSEISFPTHRAIGRLLRPRRNVEIEEPVLAEAGVAATRSQQRG
jgi:CDP-diacylglycerol--serine O-phosphatidyltransferase